MYLNIFLRTSVSPPSKDAPVLTDKMQTQILSVPWRQSCQVVINELTHSCHELNMNIYQNLLKCRLLVNSKYIIPKLDDRIKKYDFTN